MEAKTYYYKKNKSLFILLLFATFAIAFSCIIPYAISLPASMQAAFFALFFLLGDIYYFKHTFLPAFRNEAVCTVNENGWFYTKGMTILWNEVESIKYNKRKKSIGIKFKDLDHSPFHSYKQTKFFFKVNNYFKSYHMELKIDHLLGKPKDIYNSVLECFNQQNKNDSVASL